LKRKFTVIFLCFAILLGYGFAVLGEEKQSNTDNINSQINIEKENEKKLSKLQDISGVISKASTKLSVSAEGVVLYCANNNQVIYEKNQHKKMKMASTTKVMTSLLCLEAAAADNAPVTFTKEMIAEGSSMYLEKGDVVRLRDLVVGMLLPSGNDAANAAAITICGSIEDFAQLMNERAAQIGMKDTNFVTPSGLDDENHYSTPYDMALLLSYAMENAEFAEIAAKKTCKVEFEKPKGKSYTYGNHNKLLSQYENCIGGKTGFTKAAGRCLVSVAEKDGLRLIAVTMKASDDWNDHKSMFNFGFDNLACIRCDDTKNSFEINVAGGTVDKVTAGSLDSKDFVVQKSKADNVKRYVYTPSFIYAPVERGHKLGKVIYVLGDLIIAENKIQVMENIEGLPVKKGFWNLFKK